MKKFGIAYTVIPDHRTCQVGGVYARCYYAMIFGVKVFVSV